MLSQIIFALKGVDFPRILVLITVGIVLGACGGSDRPKSVSSSPQAEKAHSITLYTWDEYFDPKVLQAFTEKTGIGVNLETFEDTDEVETTIRANPNRYDLLVFDGDKVEEFCHLGLVRKLDHQRLPQLDNIDPKYLDLAIDRGNKFSVPYLWGTTLVAYRKDKIAHPANSWSLLWDPQYRGKVAMLNERIESINIAMFKNGFSMNSRDPDALAVAEISLLDQIAEMDVKYVEGLPSAIEKTLVSGDAWAMAAYSGDAAMIADKDERIGLLIPDEGAAIWIDNFVIPRRTLRSDEAHEFINFMLTPEVAAKNASFLHYATPNLKAKPFLDPELREDPAIFPADDVIARCEFSGTLTPERERPLNRIWSKVMAARQGLPFESAPSGAKVTEVNPQDGE